MQILLGYLVLVAQIKQEINDKVKHTLRKETISEAEIETFLNFLFDDYLDITIPPAPNDAGLDTTKTQDLKTETRHILQICQLEEEVCSTIEDTIKRCETPPVPRALQQELFTYQSCAKWTLRTIHKTIQPQQQGTNPKQVIQVHSEYIWFSLEAIKGIEKELQLLNKAEQQTDIELSQISSLCSD